jgi:hypothetical protein
VELNIIEALINLVLHDYGHRKFLIKWRAGASKWNPMMGKSAQRTAMSCVFST